MIRGPRGRCDNQECADILLHTEQEFWHWRRTFDAGGGQPCCSHLAADWLETIPDIVHRAGVQQYVNTLKKTAREFTHGYGRALDWNFWQRLSANMHAATCLRCGSYRQSWGLHRKLCRKCGNTVYCSRVCQTADWPVHKHNCTTLRTDMRVSEFIGPPDHELFMSTLDRIRYNAGFLSTDLVLWETPTVLWQHNPGGEWET
jgi:hypothetical protein